MLVEKVVVGKDRQLKIAFRLDVRALLGCQDDFSEIRGAGTYTDISDLLRGAEVIVTV